MKIPLSALLTAVLYTGAGIVHFIRPEAYLRIMPPWVPHPHAAVFWSGVAEVVLGLAVFFRRSRRIAAVGIIALLVVVFPANVQMATDWWQADHPAKWLAIARLPLQLLLIWWAWKVRKA